MLTNASDDPLDEALRPPSDETPEQRIERLEREAEAKRVSLAIDANIKAERQARRRKRIVRLLLLGQSESGMLPFYTYRLLHSSVNKANPQRYAVRRLTMVLKVY